MLLYSWNKILTHAETLNDIIIIMHSIVWPSELYSKHHHNLRKFSNIDFKGHSFLLHPEPLLNNPKIPKEHIVQYISLASKRSFANFLLTGEKRLDRRLTKLSPTENELITIENEYISFAYE